MGEETALRGKQPNPIPDKLKFCPNCGIEFEPAGSANKTEDCGECGFSIFLLIK